MTTDIEGLYSSVDGSYDDLVKAFRNALEPCNPISFEVRQHILLYSMAAYIVRRDNKPEAQDDSEHVPG